MRIGSLYKIGFWLVAVAAICVADVLIGDDGNKLMRQTTNVHGSRDLVGFSFWEDIKETNQLQDNVAITLQEVLGDSFHIGTEPVYIPDLDMEPVNVFSSNATIKIDEYGNAPPNSLVFKKKDDPTFMIAFSSDGRLQRVSMTDPVSGEATSIVPVDVDSTIFISVHESDVDQDLLKKFKYGNPPPVPPVEDEAPPSASPDGKPRDLHHKLRSRSLAETCTSFSVIKMAVAYDSSFCKHFGSQEAAVNAVQMIIAEVSDKYGQDGLCVRVVLSHLEGFCDPANDPYAPVLSEATSVCNDENAFLQRFRAFWRANRTGVHRDIAHLFHGKPDPMATDEENRIGCAWIGTLCRNDVDYAYGVNQINFFNLLSGQVNLVAHEIGHNANAQHDSAENFIMSKSVSSSKTADFSFASVQAIRGFVDRKSCLDTEDAPTSVPTSTPSSAPSSTPSRSAQPSSKPSIWPIVYPTQSFSTPTETVSPSLHPSKLPSLRPSISPSARPSPGPSSVPSLSPSSMASQAPSGFPTDVCQAALFGYCGNSNNGMECCHGMTCMFNIFCYGYWP